MTAIALEPGELREILVRSWRVLLLGPQLMCHLLGLHNMSLKLPVQGFVHRPKQN